MNNPQKIFFGRKYMKHMSGPALAESEVVAAAEALLPALRERAEE